MHDSLQIATQEDVFDLGEPSSVMLRDGIRFAQVVGMTSLPREACSMKNLFESVRPHELKESSTTLPEMVLYRDSVHHELHSTFVETGRVDEFFVMFYQAKRV